MRGGTCRHTCCCFSWRQCTQIFPNSPKPSQKFPPEAAINRTARVPRRSVTKPGECGYAVYAVPASKCMSKTVPASKCMSKCRVLQGEQEREHTPVCDRTVHRSKARDLPCIGLPLIHLIRRIYPAVLRRWRCVWICLFLPVFRLLL